MKTIINIAISTGSLLIAFTASAQQQMKIITSTQVIQTPARADVVTDPADQHVCEDGTAVFHVIATGDAPITYQWLYNGTPLPETDDTLRIENIIPAHSGAYQCVVTNGCGSDTSAVATLYAYAKPIAYNVTGGGTFCQGSGSVTVELDGSEVGVTYQLVVDGSASGSPVSGTGSALVFSGLTVPGQYMITGITSYACTGVMNGFVMATEYPAITLTLTSQFEPTCYNACDGSLHFTATGSSGYTYDSGTETNATGSFYGLCDGSYIITVTDANSCSTSAAGTLTQPSEINVSVISQTATTCNGICDGTAAISYTGGTGSHTIEWSNGETTASALALCGGSNYVTVTDQNSCYYNMEVIISEPSAYIITETMTSPDCFNDTNGEIVLAVSGSTPPYQYNWSDMLPHGSNATGLASGSFTITITDAALCDTIVTFILTQPDTLIINEALFNPSCLNNDGQIITSPLGGNGGFVYLWGGGETTSDIINLGAGSYSLTVTDINNCVASDVFVLNPVSVNPVLKGQVSYSGGNFGAGEAIVKVFNEIDNPAGSILFEYYNEAVTTSNGFEIQVPSDNYILRGVLTSPASYPDVFSTYYNGTAIGYSTIWEDAEILSLGCDDTLTISFVMDETTPAIGTVTFSGAIYYWDSGTKGITTGSREVGEPVEGAEIFVEQQPNDRPVAGGSTNIDGVYNISGIEEGYTYDLTVDIPGIPLLSTYTNIFVDAGTTLVPDMNFFVDTTSEIGGIFIDSISGIESILPQVTLLSMYPNPVHTLLNIDLNTLCETDISITLADIKGREVMTLVKGTSLQGKNSFSIDISSLPSGSYFVRVISGKNAFIRKLQIE